MEYGCFPTPASQHLDNRPLRQKTNLSIFTFLHVTHDSAYNLASGEQRAGKFSTDLASDTGNCIHNRSPINSIVVFDFVFHERPTPQEEPLLLFGSMQRDQLMTDYHCQRFGSSR
jgi:hypothetical protein